jgi:hypothetical protein
VSWRQPPVVIAEHDTVNTTDINTFLQAVMAGGFSGVHQTARNTLSRVITLDIEEDHFEVELPRVAIQWPAHVHNTVPLALADKEVISDNGQHGAETMWRPVGARYNMEEEKKISIIILIHSLVHLFTRTNLPLTGSTSR